ncbi:MAG TPA: hypothetical protein V6D05_14060 [Stenomitos sp.]
MTNRWSGAIALMAMGLMSACQLFTPAAIQRAATARVQGTVFVPAKQILVGYRTQEAASLVEKPGVGATVRLVTRDGQGLSGLTEARVDGAGQFAFQQEVPEGLYLAVATFSETSRVMAFLRVKAGSATTTVLTAASTMVANRLGRTRLKLSTLQQPEFDEIAAQARSMMTDADVPALTPEGVSAGTDTFLSSHLIIKSRIEALLSRLAHDEGVSDDPTATLPVSESPAPGTSPAPTTPDPVYTPIPKPTPTSVDLSGTTTLSVMKEVETDSTPYWVEMDGSQFLWVSCPASNSIMRFEAARPNWTYSRPTTSLLRDRFVPGQIAVDNSAASPVVWVGNLRSDGTRVARYDEWGNFLGSVDVGPAPAALGLDTDGSGRKAWIGVTGDDSGKVVVADPTGRVVSTGQVTGKPFRFIGFHHAFTGSELDIMWIATPQAFYAASVYDAHNPTLSLAADEVDLSGVPGEIRAFTLTAVGDVYVVKQEPDLRTTLIKVNPQTHTFTTPYPSFTGTGHVVSVASDYQQRLWVFTEKEAVCYTGSNKTTFSSARPYLGLFPGRDYTFWSIHEGSPQLLKRSYGS